MKIYDFYMIMHDFNMAGSLIFEENVIRKLKEKFTFEMKINSYSCHGLSIRWGFVIFPESLLFLPAARFKSYFQFYVHRIQK